MTPETVQTIAICLAVIIVAFLGFKAFQNISSKAIDAPRQIVKAGGDAFRDNIQAVGTELRNLLGATPEITLNRTVIQQAPTTICELYFTKQHTETREQFTSKKFGSSKALVVSQKFVIKAGFDLNRLRLQFDDQKRELRATIADALLVSVEHEGPFQVEKSESGWWNRITSQERDRLINSLPQKARDQLETATLRQLALARLEEVLTRVCDRKGLQLQVTCEADGNSVREAKALVEPSTLAIDKLSLFDEQKFSPPRT